MGFLAALASLAAPITARVLIALGFSVVTVTGVTVAWTAILDQLQANIASMPSAISQLAGLAGLWLAMAPILGAMAFIVTLWGLTAAVRITAPG